jgi:hypothetical protein
MTQSYQAEQAAIFTRLRDLWVVGNKPRTRIAFPNVQFTPTKEEDYIEPRIVRQDSFNVDLVPNRRVRHPGLLTINVRTRLNRGDGPALELADHAAAIFRNVTFASITFRAPTVRDFGIEGTSIAGTFAAGAYYLVQVDCPYYRDSIFQQGA